MILHDNEPRGRIEQLKAIQETIAKRGEKRGQPFNVAICHFDLPAGRREMSASGLGRRGRICVSVPDDLASIKIKWLTPFPYSQR